MVKEHKNTKREMGNGERERERWREVQRERGGGEEGAEGYLILRRKSRTGGFAGCIRTSGSAETAFPMKSVSPLNFICL